jgi:stage II sporulation protein M
MKNAQKTKKKKFSLSGEYKQSWRYIRESKKFIFFILGFFLLFALIGFAFPLPQDFYDKLMSYLKQILEQTKGMSQFELIKFIFINNIKSTFFGLFFGVIWGIYPLVSALANGYILGFVSFLSVSQSGITSLWRIFPHGIFELPAIFISLGLGLKMGTFIFEKEKLKTFENYLINSVRAFLLIVIPLLFIAGVIEGTLIALTG